VAFNRHCRIGCEGGTGEFFLRDLETPSALASVDVDPTEVGRGGDYCSLFVQKDEAVSQNRKAGTLTNRSANRFTHE
jgi:hypothetical protein